MANLRSMKKYDRSSSIPKAVQSRLPRILSRNADVSQSRTRLQEENLTGNAKFQEHMVKKHEQSSKTRLEHTTKKHEQNSKTYPKHTFKKHEQNFKNCSGHMIKKHEQNPKTHLVYTGKKHEQNSKTNLEHTSKQNSKTHAEYISKKHGQTSKTHTVSTKSQSVQRRLSYSLPKSQTNVDDGLLCSRRKSVPKQDQKGTACSTPLLSSNTTPSKGRGDGSELAIEGHYKLMKGESSKIIDASKRPHVPGFQFITIFDGSRLNPIEEASLILDSDDGDFLYDCLEESVNLDDGSEKCDRLTDEMQDFEKDSCFVSESISRQYKPSGDMDHLCGTLSMNPCESLSDRYYTAPSGKSTSDCKVPTYRSLHSPFQNDGYLSNTEMSFSVEYQDSHRVSSSLSTIGFEDVSVTSSYEHKPTDPSNLEPMHKRDTDLAIGGCYKLAKGETNRKDQVKLDDKSIGSHIASFQDTTNFDGSKLNPIEEASLILNSDNGAFLYDPFKESVSLDDSNRKCDMKRSHIASFQDITNFDGSRLNPIEEASLILNTDVGTFLYDPLKESVGLDDGNRKHDIFIDEMQDFKVYGKFDSRKGFSITEDEKSNTAYKTNSSYVDCAPQHFERMLHSQNRKKQKESTNTVSFDSSLVDVSSMLCTAPPKPTLENKTAYKMPQGTCEELAERHKIEHFDFPVGHDVALKSLKPPIGSIECENNSLLNNQGLVKRETSPYRRNGQCGKEAKECQVESIDRNKMQSYAKEFNVGFHSMHDGETCSGMCMDERVKALESELEGVKEQNKKLEKLLQSIITTAKRLEHEPVNVS